MGDPVLHLLAGPNGAGKSTLFARAVGPETHLPFVDADSLAEARWGADAAVARVRGLHARRLNFVLR